MRNVLRFAKLTSMLGLLAISSTVMAAGQTGGTYSLTIDGGAPIALTSLDYGENSVVNGATGPGGSTLLSPVTITTSAGAEVIPTFVSNCVTHLAHASMTATYSNAQGQAQFAVKFTPMLISSISLPAVDKTSSAPGLITIVFGVMNESVESPPSASGAPPKQLQARVNSPSGLQRVWHASPQRPTAAGPNGKFSLTVAGADTSGVLTVSPFTITTSGYGGFAGKVTLAPLVLTVDATKAANFVSFNAQHSPIATAVLTYNRQDDGGRNDVITIKLANLLVTSCAFTGNTGSAPYYTVQLTFQKLSIQGSSGKTIATWDSATAKGS